MVLLDIDICEVGIGLYNDIVDQRFCKKIIYVLEWFNNYSIIILVREKEIYFYLVFYIIELIMDDNYYYFIWGGYRFLDIYVCNNM